MYRVCVCMCVMNLFHDQEHADAHFHLPFTSPGVGDVCSFAEMDVKKHGNPDVRQLSLLLLLRVTCVQFSLQWQVSPLTRAGRQEQADLGKTEMSLMQFSVSVCTCIRFSLV